MAASGDCRNHPRFDPPWVVCGCLHPSLRVSPAYLLPGAGHLQTRAEVVQPVPLFVPPQAGQVFPQHLDDLGGVHGELAPRPECRAGEGGFPPSPPTPTHLLHLQPHSLKALGMAFLQDVQL